MQKVQENSCQSCKKVTIFGENIHLEKFHPYEGLVGEGARDTCVSKNVNPAGDDLLPVLTVHALSN